jgi:hypothetical protein
MKFNKKKEALKEELVVGTPGELATEGLEKVFSTPPPGAKELLKGEVVTPTVLFEPEKIAQDEDGHLVRKGADITSRGTSI